MFGYKVGWCRGLVLLVVPASAPLALLTVLFAVLCSRSSLSPRSRVWRMGALRCRRSSWDVYPVQQIPVCLSVCLNAPRL